MQLHKRRKPEGSTRAFSLVEVTLAIGITAVALVSLMGMLPKGLQTLQRANDKAVMGRIHQQIMGEIQLTPWEKSDAGTSPLDEFDGQVRYYDDQGIELPSNEAGEFSHVYTARISIPSPDSSLPRSVGQTQYRGVRIPGENVGANPDADPDAYMRLVIVEVTSLADPNFLDNPENGFDNITDSKQVSTYRTLAVKMGQEYES